MWSEERNGSISPIVDSALGGILSVELKDWEQLYCGDT
jgi:hypothetical protein